MTENDIIDQSFYILEKDSTPWEEGDDEYTTARGFLNLGVKRWEHYENTTWRELWILLSNASGGQSTVSAATWNYDAPSDFIREGGYVTTTASDGSVTFWKVLPPEEYQKYADSTANICYFSGNSNSGHSLNFNPKTTPSVGATIEYPYYKAAVTSSATSTVLEPSDPNFLSYFIASHMSESTESIDPDLFTIAEGLLKQMKSKNNSGVWGVPFNIEDSLEDMVGFGTGGVGVVTSANPTGR
jgi:hypothetical protein